jgi:predicted O-methyltransferase YrrM
MGIQKPNPDRDSQGTDVKSQYFDALCSQVKYGNQDSDRHVLTCFSIAMQIHAKRILELGVRTGNTTFPFLLAAQELGGMVHSVDLEPTTFQCPEELRLYWKFFQSDAHSWLERNINTQPGQYDLIYIDDWHSYDHVKRELELLAPICTPSTVILLHDLMHSFGHPNYRSDPDCSDPQWAGGGPYRAVAELDPAVWEWSTIPVNHGFTILRKKGQVIP